MTTGEVLDFVGGRADLAAGIIRAIGDPSRRFAEDKLRMPARRPLRCAFRPTPSNPQLSPPSALTRAKSTSFSAERIREELTKLLTEGAARRGFELLDELGPPVPTAPRNRRYERRPAASAIPSRRRRLGSHPPDARGFYQPEASPTLAWGVLLHDIGKPPTFRSSSETGDRIRFDGHVDVGVPHGR